MTTTTAPRSNRPLTQFACRQLEEFILNSSQYSDGETKVSEGNTTVWSVSQAGSQYFKVFLFNEEILSVACDNGKPFSVRVSFTSYYDLYGQPTSTTVERLNGLLDRLGALGVLPKGVRLFRDNSGHEPLTYIGKGENKSAVGKEIAESVFIRPNSQELDIVGFLSSLEIEEQGNDQAA